MHAYPQRAVGFLKTRQQVIDEPRKSAALERRAHFELIVDV